MPKHLLRVATCGLMFLLGLCAYSLLQRTQSPTASTAIVPSVIVPNTRKRPECELLDDFDDADELNYQNFKVVTKYKTVRFDGLKFSTEVSWAELRQGKKRIATFAGVTHPMGNVTEFGMFKLLGKNETQLIVQQTAWRSGNHWIFDLSDGNARKIYSSWDWDTAREDVCVVDLDGDGTLEISQLITDFYDLMDKFAISLIPLPSIVFKYDQQTRQYSPANHEFLEYVFAGVTDVDATVNSNSRLEQSLIIGTLLDYVFAGQREKGWQFFDRNYRGDDRNEMRKRIQAILNEQPVYRFIYKL